MQEAADLMAALRRLIRLEESVHEGYTDAGISLMDIDWVDFGAGMFQAGRSHGDRAKVLRAELSGLEAKYGPAPGI